MGKIPEKRSSPYFFPEESDSYNSSSFQRGGTAASHGHNALRLKLLLNTALQPIAGQGKLTILISCQKESLERNSAGE
jgi:hypothetical protein